MESPIEATNGGFVHLHLHTEFSLLDGSIRISELACRLVELGMTSCAITDHGVMYGAVEFYKTMTDKGIHPIIGCEVYVAVGSRFDKQVIPNGTNYHHLILLAKDNEGLKNLNRLVSAGFTEGFYRKPRIDWELLCKYHEGLICLSACLAGELSNLILENKFSECERRALEFDELFGRGNYYLEIQNNRLPEQGIINSSLIKLSRKTGIPLVATNDCHYLLDSDYEVEDVLLCMQTGSKLSDNDRMRMAINDFFVKSETQMRRFFVDVPDAIENTNKIASMCNAQYDFDTIHLPKYDIPQGFKDNKEYLSFIAYEGLNKKFELIDIIDEEIKNEYKQRIEHELSVINGMGYTDYYLIVWDFISFAKQNSIMVGPGRGSGAGSLVAYTIGITNIDPIKYKLVFERFLNSERVSMPDFDIDFCYERRQEVIDYVTAKYGQERVAQVITFGTLAARLCIRDVARVMDLPYAVADKVAKLIPENIGITISKALEMNKELRDEYESDESIKKVLDYSMRLEGLPRHSSTHAAGVIISGQEITNIAPLSVNENSTVVQFAKADIESVGLLKFDFLGLRTLTVLRDTVDMVHSNLGTSIDLDRIPLDDANIYKMIGNGQTVGVFQLESRGMTAFMRDLKPSSLEDVIAGISLYRPGPMDQIPKYIACKHDSSLIKYDHPLLEPILNVTYGCMVYQEQVMQIVRDLAGFSMGQSDNIRRAMSKKKRSIMEKYRELFIHGGIDDKNRVVDGCIKRGVDEKTADKIFNDVSNFAGYAFNKSHAAAYAVLAYDTAYLKYYYPSEFMAAMMNSFRNSLGAAAWYITCCEPMGIKILPPDVNKSVGRFTTEESGEKLRAVRIGLSVIKNVGEGAVNLLVKEREKNQEFKSFSDFIVRSAGIGLNRKMIESLIFSSGLDWTGYSRATMVATIQTELDRLAKSANSSINGQLSLFDNAGMNVMSEPQIRMTEVKEYPLSEKLALEKEMVGIYISGHPLNSFKKSITELVTFDMGEVKDLTDSGNLSYLNDDKEIIMCGMLQRKNVRVTKAKKQMCVCQFEDIYGHYEAVMFGRVFDEFASSSVVNNAYLVVGKRRLSNQDAFSMVIDRIIPMPVNDEEIASVMQNRDISRIVNASRSAYKMSSQSDPLQEKTLEKELHIRFNGSLESKEYKRLLNFLAFFHGNLPVVVQSIASNASVRLDDVCSVSDDEGIIDRLKELCGSDNVQIVFK